MAQGKQLARLAPQVYRDPRPKEYFDRFHERARAHDPDWVYELMRLISSPIAYLAFRAHALCTELVPGSGPVILAPNHFSYMDHFLIGCYLRRKIRFMGKSQLFSFPMQFFYSHGGVFPVRRGARDEEAFITARAILGRGGAVAMYPEGGRSRTGELAQHARPGIGRLALQTGAPVVPIAIYGSERIRNWKRLQLPQVTVQYGSPIRWQVVEEPTADQSQAVADAVFVAIKQLHQGLERHGRRGMARALRRARVDGAGAAGQGAPSEGAGATG